MTGTALAEAAAPHVPSDGTGDRGLGCRGGIAGRLGRW